MKKKTLILAGLTWLCMMLPVFSPAAFAVDGGAVAEDLDNYFVPAFPIVYGEIIDSFPADQVANISAVLKGVEIFDYMYKIGTIGDSLASGSANMDTALDAATVTANLAIKFMADEATKKILIAGVGVGTLPLTALITSIDIARSSYKAVAASKIALDLEVLYYSVENDSLLKNTGRELGEGDPIKTDQAAVEHLFRKCLRDPAWAPLFKTYVTTELGQPWPEPSLWDRLTVDNDFLEEAAIFEEKKRLQSHIATLLLELNKVGKKREAQVVAAKQMQAIRDMSGKISPEELRKALSLYNSALQRLPDIKDHVAKLPAIIEDLKKRVENVTAVELETLRVETISNLMNKIVSQMSYVRYLPTKGKDAGTRQELLKALKENYNALFSMKTTISVEKVNERLEKEAKALTVQNQEFVVKRHPCPKFFEDYLPSFEKDIQMGITGSQGLTKAYEEVQKNREEVAKAYEADFKENEKLYQNKLEEFNSKIKEVGDQIAATPTKEYETISRLRNLLNSLKNQRDDLIDRYKNKYLVLFISTSTVDINQCEKITSEIQRFIETYGNKYGTIQAYLEEFYNDARSKQGLFYASHGNGQTGEAFVSESTINDIRNTLKENNGGAYAYTDLEFLKDLVKKDPDQAVSVNVQKSLDDITEALKHTMAQVSASRMKAYGKWREWTIPQLKYMESAKCVKDIQVVIDAADVALAEYRKVDPDDISKAYEPKYKQAIADLLSIKAGMERCLQLRSKAAGLASQLSSYLDKADAVNQRVETDTSYLSGLYVRFWNAQAGFKMHLAHFIAKNAMARDQSEKLPSVLPGTELKNSLEENGIMAFSRKRGLGIEELFVEPFCDVGTDKGVISLKETHFQGVLAGISKLPNHNIADYYKGYHALRDKEGAQGLIMRMSRFQSEFTALFGFESTLEKAAQKIVDEVNKKRAEAQKAQDLIDAEKNLFEAILIKVNHLLSFSRTQMESNMYSSVMMLGDQKEVLLAEYKGLGKTRSDVDAAFKELTELIELAKSKYLEDQSKPLAVDMGPIREFYEKFKVAYESRNDAQLMDLIHDDWEAGDGTTLADLEMNLSRTFRTFDEIQYRISNLNAMPQPNGRYLVTYDVAITSRMFERNLKHEEKSSVSEEVTIDEAGRVRITKTLSGRFWTD